MRFFPATEDREPVEATVKVPAVTVVPPEYELVKFREEHGHCRVSTLSKPHAALASWVRTQRANKKVGRLRAEQIRRLDGLGFTWDMSARRSTATTNVPLTQREAEVLLTHREAEVLRKLAGGLTNKQIAEAMEISCETVKKHVRHIFPKIGVQDRKQAALWAIGNGSI